MRADFKQVFSIRKSSLLMGCWTVILILHGVNAQATSNAFDSAGFNSRFSDTPGYTAKEYALSLFDFPRGIKTGFRFRTESSDLAIPDLGGPASFMNVDAEALANDLSRPQERDLAPGNVKSVRSNWLNYSGEDFKVDLIQSPARSGIRFLHMGSGLRFEAERKLLTGYSSLFVGVRLAEDKRYEPSAGCTYTQQRSESRSFCGLRVKIGL